MSPTTKSQVSVAKHRSWWNTTKTAQCGPTSCYICPCHRESGLDAHMSRVTTLQHLFALNTKHCMQKQSCLYWNVIKKKNNIKFLKVQFPSGSATDCVLITRPVAGSGRRADSGFFMVWAVAVGGWVGNARTAGGCGRAGGGLGLDLLPLVFAQSLGEVVVDGHADGELLGATLLVVGPEAPLEMLLEDVVKVAFGGRWKRTEAWQMSNTRLGDSRSVCLRVSGNLSVTTRCVSERLASECLRKGLTWWVAPVHIGSAGRLFDWGNTSDHRGANLKTRRKWIFN